MHPLTNEIIASREWRMRELEDLKKVGILALNTYPQKVKDQYYRMCIPYIYAHWEGFIVESFKQLISFLNDLHLDKKLVRNELYAFSLQDILKPLAGKQSFEQTCQFAQKFTENYDRALYIDPALLTAKSNLNYKQLVVILGKFGMENCLTKYQGEINQLVNQRNRIAHGENGITVEYANISDKISMLQEIFDLMILKFEEYLSERMYLK
ncbi:hypothetical protein IMSAGC019_02450 [Lachnospiraceae bacterium]|nr:hypothetical protein IMSAGC019_02450 [Lachnospiraceae bacterium]